MKYSRARRYGATHVAARVAQVDSLLLRIADYAREIAGHGESLAAYQAQSLWLDEGLMSRAAASLDTTAAAIDNLAERARSVRRGFLGLPRLTDDNSVRPEPVAHESLDEA